MALKFEVTVTDLSGTAKIISGLSQEDSLHDLALEVAVAFDASVYCCMLILDTEILALNAGAKSLAESGIKSGSQLSFTETSTIKWLPASLRIVSFGNASVPGKLCGNWSHAFHHRASMLGTFMHDPIPTNPHVFMRGDGHMIYWGFGKRQIDQPPTLGITIDGVGYYWISASDAREKKRYADPTFSGFGVGSSVAYGSSMWKPAEGKSGRYTSGIVMMEQPPQPPPSWGVEFNFEGLSTEVYGNDDFLSARAKAIISDESPAPDMDFQDSDEEDGMMELSDEQFEKYKASDAAARQAMRLEIDF